MMKIRVDKARVHVVMRNKTEGSVLQGAVQSTCLGFETQLQVESDEPAERIQRLVRTAENGCFTLQALLAPVPVQRSTTLNGVLLEDGLGQS
jgi:organic hydroperoxide reductase OsmC/OhrA